MENNENENGSHPTHLYINIHNHQINYIIKADSDCHYNLGHSLTTYPGQINISRTAYLHTHTPKI